MRWLISEARNSRMCYKGCHPFRELLIDAAKLQLFFDITKFFCNFLQKNFPNNSKRYFNFTKSCRLLLRSQSARWQGGGYIVSSFSERYCSI